jgi:hypothetical protein
VPGASSIPNYLRSSTMGCPVGSVLILYRAQVRFLSKTQ